jgi:hypothetical protein
MNATNRLNLLLSDILHHEPASNKDVNQGSLTQTIPSLTFAEHDYHPSSILPSVTATSPPSSIVPLLPRRNSSSVKHHRQRHYIHHSDKQKQQQPPQPLLNSSTLDDLFRALTLECEQYLAASSASSYQNKTYGQLLLQPTATIQTNIDSNDDDYENLHSSKLPVPNGIPSLKTSIEVISPEKRQVVSISVSSKIASSPIVPSSRTYPLLSTSFTTTPMVTSMLCHSSEDDSIDMSSSSANRKRRRRPRKQQMVSSITRSSSSSDERTDSMNKSINEKKSTISKRSCSTDHRQQRIKSVYDNHPLSLSSQKFSTRRIRRRDISLQQHLPISNERDEYISPRFPENLCSPLSVLLTSTRTTNDFVDRSQQQQRRSRLEFDNNQPLTLLDRMHHQFYRPSPTRHNNNNNNNIPTHRIPSYPVY